MLKKAILIGEIFVLSLSTQAHDITHGLTTVPIDFVQIGGAGNMADENGIGAVGYSYEIGKYELTESQWETVRTVSGGLLDIGTANGSSAPVADISWNEIAMYCNWLTTGCFDSGAYSVSNGIVIDVKDRASAIEKYGTIYVIPTEDEWYKAAYYSASNASCSGYANGLEMQAGGLKVTGENHLKTTEGGLGLWTVGEGLLEQNGTFDMGGNLAEFTESGSSDARIVRDAYFGWSTKPGAAENTGGNTKANGYASPSYGVRLARVTGAVSGRQVITHDGTSVSMDFVWIDSAGNHADPANGLGAVDYLYKIGKYELTEEQWDAVQAVSGGALGAGTANGPAAPVAQISWNEIAMYCNWLTTGDFDSGVYTISNGVVTDVTDHEEAMSSFGIVYVIPTEDEWYKAAYYTAESESFSDYANGTDTMSGGEKVTGENHLKTTEGGLGLWTVGESQPEQNGTYDMGGNLAEWTETLTANDERAVRDAHFGWTTKSGADENTGTNDKAETYQNSSYGVRLAMLCRTSPVELTIMSLK
jgi:formylglycine-generating enzyme required for sulfatase activity